MINLCSRFELNTSELELLKRYGKTEKLKKFKSSLEIFPGQQILTLASDFRYMRWGINVSFMKKSIINSRIEKIYTTKFFEDDFKERRCLIPATAFFEWDRKNKNKYKIYVPEDKIFSIAAIFREYTSKESSISHVSILTTMAMGKMNEIHSRMPIIIPKHFEENYLMCTESKKVYEFLINNYVDLDFKNLSDSQLSFL